MFEMLRKMIFPIIIIVLLFFTGMIVLQWGMGFSGSSQAERANFAGKVNGDEITWAEYQRVFSSYYQNEAARTNGEVSDARSRELEQAAFDQLVNDKIMNQEARRHKLLVTADDIYMFLKASPPQEFQQAPAFQTDGRFDYQKYLSAMADPQFSPLWAEIEPMMRDQITKNRVVQIVTEATHVTESECRQSFIDAKETVKLGAVNCQTTAFYPKVEQATEEEKQAYFEQHREDYKVGERVVLQMVKENLLPSQADSAYAERWARELYDSVLAGSDFAELAQFYSKDPGSAENGGDLGWFEQGRMVKEFDSAAFVMTDGQISPPILTRFGWHIIKHQGYREENGKKQAHVSHILIKPEASPETLEERLRTLDQFVDRARTIDFIEAAAEANLEMQASEPLLAGQRITFLGGAPIPEISTWAFAAKPGAVSDVFRTRTNYAVVKLVEKLPAGLADYEQVADQIGRDIRDQRAKAMAKAAVDAAWAAYQEKPDLKKAAKAADVDYTELGPFSRLTSLQALDSDPKAIGAAFKLNEVGEVMPPLEYSNGYIIMKLLERETPDQMAYNDVRDSVRTALTNAKKQDTYAAWYGTVLDNAEIENNLNWQNEVEM